MAFLLTNIFEKLNSGGKCQSLKEYPQNTEEQSKKLKEKNKNSSKKLKAWEDFPSLRQGGVTKKACMYVFVKLGKSQEFFRPTLGK